MIHPYIYPGLEPQAQTLLSYKPGPTIHKIIKACSEYFGYEAEHLYRQGRKQPIATIRQLAIYIIKEQFENLSHKEIGRIFGIDHSTVTHAIKVTKERIDLNHSHFGVPFKEIYWKITLGKIYKT